ncbi:glycosyltransferase family 92 protein RCOM_0530710-like [Glycine soja]|uniref:Glycosyltransferase family 92 protein n=1 Tax=Glycine soja TaxID=3848 RepID=A0A445JLL1_GLYSO|nr:glycosyltransferase family 92 protein RCOM_0530710-like [Glycine soja]RZB99415.1 Glycosyltransferase family 92 protein [Glycine soja]
MDSSPDQTRKRNQNQNHTLAQKSLFLCFSFFLFLFFFSSSHHSFYSHTSLQPSTLSTFPTPTPFPTTKLPVSSLHVLDRILFPDHVLLTLSNPHVFSPKHFHCVYYNLVKGSTPSNSNPVFDVLVLPVLSTDRYDEFRSIARCPLPGKKFSAVDLRWRSGDDDRQPFRFPVQPTVPHSFDKLAYEVALDGDTAVVFVKGLNLRPHQISDAGLLRCHFGPQNGKHWQTTKAVAAAQEVVRCALPQSIQNSPHEARGIISVSVSHVRHEAIFDSVAKIGGYRKQINRVNMNMNKNKLELCACTMVWNQARAMKEWVIYHAWLGVEKWFIYDNNSDDEIDDVVRELEVKGYNINRVVWPWIKSQEAGFSHCSLRAKEECKWVGFFDVDEFFYLREMKQNALISTVGNLSNSIAEIRTGCLNFGPSELRTHPRNGVSVGYTCRLRTPERHKSIVRPDLLHASLLNVVHHFELKEGFGSLNMPQSVAVINHYKYQVWEIFKAKFFRRVATYVVDWKEDANIGSKDRAPGLGTEAIEPSDWRLRFCEVWDTRLKDFLLSNFADQETGLLPWERSSK